MEKDNKEYIFYNGDLESSNVELESFRKLLKNRKDEADLIRIIDIVFKKMKKDYIESFNKLTELETKEFIYPATLLLVCCIDVMAKYYYGNASDNNVSDNYKKFVSEKFKRIETIMENKKIKKSNAVTFYKNLRCSLTHSNSTKYRIGLDTLNNDSYYEYVNKNIQKVNVRKLCKKIEGILNEYRTELLKNIKNKKSLRVENFIKVLEYIYK